MTLGRCDNMFLLITAKSYQQSAGFYVYLAK